MPLAEERINILRDLGQEIRARREELGISFNDVYQKTRIQISYLEALENANYEMLPAPVYTLGFIRTYLGMLQFDELYPEFRHWLLRSTRPPGKDAKEVNNYAPPNPGFKLASRFWVFVVLLLIVFGAVTYVTYSWSTNGIPQRNGQHLAMVSPDIIGYEQGQEVNEINEDEQNEEIEVDLITSVPEPPPPPPRPQLTIIATHDDCWISVRVGNGRITERTLRRGERFEMYLTERTRVNFGRPWAVTVIHNGVDIGSPHRGGTRRPQTNFYDPDGRTGRIEASPQS